MGCVAAEEKAPQHNRKIGGADAPKDEFAAAELDPAQAKKVALKTKAREMLDKAKETSAEKLQEMADDMDSVGDEESKGLKEELLPWVNYQNEKAASDAALAKYQADLAEYNAAQATFNRSTASAEDSAQQEKDRVAQEEQARAKAKQDEEIRQQNATPQQKHRQKTVPQPIYGVSNADSIERSDPEGKCSHIVTVCCEWIEKHNFDSNGHLIENGIFRTAGSKAWVKAKIAEFNTNAFCELVDDDYIPNVASLLVNYFLEMEKNGHYLWGPTTKEARAWEAEYNDLFKETRRDEQALIQGIKQLVWKLGPQEIASWKTICHMLRQVLRAPNSMMDAKKMALCVRAAVQGPLIHMTMEWDEIFGE